MTSQRSLCVSHFQLLPPPLNPKKVTDFYEIWYEYYVIGSHPNLVHFHFLVSNNKMADGRTC